MARFNQATSGGRNRLVPIALLGSLCMLLGGVGLLLKPSPLGAQSGVRGTVPETYTLTIRYPSGKDRVVPEVISHKLISEKNSVLMSVILKNGARLLLSIHDREFEFSPELSRILEAEARSKSGE